MTAKNENAHRARRALSAADDATGTLPMGADAGKGTPWSAPLPLPLRRGGSGVPVLTADLLPQALRPWLVDLAERMQVPLEFPTVAALVSLSSLVGRKVAIRPKQFDDWSEVGNLWGLVVGWPGILKTPAMECAMDPLNLLEADAMAAYEREHADDEADEAVRRARIKGIEAKIAEVVQAEPSADVESLRDTLRRLKAPREPMPRYVTHDPTIERLGRCWRTIRTD